jgi:hypothetical protein
MHGVLDAASLELATRDCREAVVESFAITGHPKAKRCYAWSFREGSEPRYVTALEIPPVDSPQTAVRAAIVSKAQK